MEFVGKTLNGCLMNASGVNCTTLSELQELNQCDSVAAIVTKSCTLTQRDGNEHPRWAATELGGIQSNGLCNEGYNQYIKYSFDNKPYIVSIAENSIDNYTTIINAINECDNIDGIEINLSCPNAFCSQIGYNFDETSDYINAISKVCKKPFGIKLPVYYESSQIKRIAAIIGDYNVNFITCCNSLSNGLFVDWDTESTLIKPRNGLGGVGGSYIKPMSLSNVYQFRKLLPKTTIIGCGGIITGKDVCEYILCGADLVQVGVTLYKEGMSCMERIKNEYEELMNEKKYLSFNDFKSKLKKS